MLFPSRFTPASVIGGLAIWLVTCLAAHNDVDVRQTCGFKESDVKYFDVKIDHTAIPPSLTTYVCQDIPIPESPNGGNNNVHAIGFLPLIYEPHIVHHMIMFGCQEGKTSPITDDINPKLNVHHCSGEDNECRHFLVQWSKGLEGPICNHPNAGFLIGKLAINSLSMQIHWNNQNAEKNLSDASGFRVFYTQQLRPYDMGNVQVGQNDLTIPPFQPRVLQSGSCSSECTKYWLQHPIYLTRAHLHMHYTGDGGAMYIKKRGSQVIQVFNDSSFEYNKPSAHSFSKPVQVNPGDEIKVTCAFNTRDGMKRRNRTLFWGEGSDGEMCYAFISYYPYVQDFDQCIQLGQHDICTTNG